MKKLPIVALGRDGQVLSYYESIAEAARMNGFSESSISHALSSNGISHKVRWIREADYRDYWFSGRTDELRYSYKQFRAEIARKGWISQSKEKLEERKRNISRARKKTISERPEVMEPARRTRCCPVECITTGERFESILAFSEKYGVHKSWVSHALCHGKRVKGLIIKRIKN